MSEEKKDKKEKSKYSNKRNEIEKAVDRELIKELRLQRWGVRKMSFHPDLNHISFAQIYADVKIIEKQWKEKTALDLDAYKVKQMQSLDYLIREASEAWTKSKKEKIKRNIKEKSIKAEDKDLVLNKETSASTESNTGDANYLKAFIDALKEQNKMLGLHAPSKSELSGNIKIEPITGMEIH